MCHAPANTETDHMIRPTSNPRHRHGCTSASLGMLLLAAIPAIAQTPHVQFNPMVSYEASNSEPRRIHTADFNRDGHLDALVSMSGTDSSPGLLTVLFGNGTGALVDNTDFANNQHWWGIASGDFNRDNRRDIVGAAGGNDVTAVGVFAGNGSGSFSPMANLNSGRFPIAAVVGDWNGDGTDDIIVANNVTYGATLFVGNGDGTFGPATHIPAAAGLLATDICTGDFNHDQKPDLAIAHYSGVTVLKGDGAGNFTLYAGTGGSNLKNRVATGDVNGDGIDDIIVGEQYTNRVIVCLSNGINGFSANVPYTTGGSVTGVATSDLNRDGHVDVCVSTSDSTGAEIFLNSGDGSGTLLPRVEWAAGPQPTAIAVADMNEDGFDDLLITCRNLGDTPSISILLQVPQLALAVDGTCPGGGPLRITWYGATPNGQVALIFAANTGSFIIPQGNPCQGTALGLGASQLRVAYRGASGPRGTRTLTTNAGPSACGGYLQLLDSATCTTSNVARIR